MLNNTTLDQPLAVKPKKTKQKKQHKIEILIKKLKT